MQFTAIKNKLFLYIQNNKKNILFGLGSLLFLVVFAIVSVFIVERLEEFRFTQAEHNATSAISSEKEFLLERAKQISEMDELHRSIKERDVLNILSTLEDVKRRHNIPLMLVTDERGITLTRLDAVSRRGDFVYQTSSWGRAVGRGEDMVSIENGIAHPLVMIAGTQVFDNGDSIGSVFPAYSLNDEYAREFSRNFLKNGAEMAFYSEDYGITGTSISDSGMRDMLFTAFGKDSDWIVSGRTDEKATINGTDYFVKNIKFEGIEGSVGGALLFLPQRHAYNSLVLAGLAALILLVISLAVFFDDFKFNIKAKGLTCVCTQKNFSTFVLVFAVLFVGLFFVNKGIFSRQSIDISAPPHVIYNATMHFSPESDIFDPTFLQRVDVNLRIGGETINAAQAVISFDPSLAEVEEVLTGDSFCRQDLFIEKSIDNVNGEVVVICGTTFGYNAPEANLVTLVINPLREGDLVLSFEEGTQVLAHDGLGTNVLRMAESSSYKIVSGRDGVGIPFTVFSPSHPNSVKWYNKQRAQFSWIGSEDREYWYEFNTDPNAVPLGQNTTTGNSISFNIEEDGIYYFHITPEDEEEVLRYRVLADKTPPSSVSIRASRTNVNINEVVRLEFFGEDELSGLQDGFYIKFDDRIFLPVGRSFSTAFLEPGTRNITLRVFDRAGNYADSEIEINVSKESFRDRFFRWWR